MKNKIESKRTKFKTKHEAYLTFIAYLAAPWFLTIGLSIAVSKTRLSDQYTDEQMRQVLLIGIVGVALVLVYSWCQMFRIFFFMNSKAYDSLPEESEIPETAKCLDCHEVFAGKHLTTMKCTKCGGKLENLIGFFERHPELNNEKETKKI